MLGVFGRSFSKIGGGLLRSYAFGKGHRAIRSMDCLYQTVTSNISY